MQRLRLKIITLILAALISVHAFAAPAFAVANVSAWLPSWDVEEAFQSFKNNSGTIDTISPFWYHLNENGNLDPTENAEDPAIIKFAKDNGIPIIPTISNSFDGEKVSGIINNPELKKENIQKIVVLVKTMNYDGIDIDYEGLKSEDKEAFTAYIRDLRGELNKYMKKLTIAIQAKTINSLAIYGDRGQDWAQLSQYVDEFRIMTYDYGWRGSIPRPVAPYTWVEEVVQYAKIHVPDEKIYLGVPFYGYGWSDDYFTSYTYDTINLILSKYGVDFQYDPATRTNRLFYVSEFDERDPKIPHEVWFENHVSLEAKLELVDKYNLGGIAIWRLGKEDPENWTSIRRILKEEPIGDKLYFEDVNQNVSYYDEITKLAKLGIVKGYGDTKKFLPLRKVNRAEILKMVLNSFAKDISAYIFDGSDVENPFVDAIVSEWYFPYVLAGVNFEIIEGYPDGSFKPARNIIRVEVLKLALESAGINVGTSNGSDWYEPYKNWAVEHGLYGQNAFVANEEITRAEAAYIIVKVIEAIE